MPATTENWVGTLADGRYEITDRLGAGGMGIVYKARDQKLQADVVIKAPRPEMLANPQFAGRFAREVRSLVQLSHPHIVKVLDVGEHAGLPYAVMQYLAGGSLRDRQQPGPDGQPLPLPPEALVGWLEDVALALDFMHAQGYIHRDIKPDNILFDATGHVYLGDFGVAKVVADARPKEERTVATGTGGLLGTARYMAPELLREKNYDGRIDQYALAVMVYELLSGRPPFEGPPAVVCALHLAKTPPALHELTPSVPRELSATIHRALSKKPAERFPTCGEFARAVLQPSGGTQPPVATNIAPPPAIPVAPSTPAPIPAPPAETQLPDQAQAETQAARPGKRKDATPRGATGRTKRDATAIDTAPPRRLNGEGLLIAVSIGVLLVVFTAAVGFVGWRVWHGRQPPVLISASEEDKGPKEDPADNKAKSASPAPFRLLPLSPVELQPGESKSFEVSVERRGFQGAIRLDLDGLPDKAAARTDTIAPEADSARIQLIVAADAQDGEHDVRLRARGEGAEADTPLRIVIKKALSPSLRLAPIALIALKAGENRPLAVTVQRQSCQGAVAIEVHDLPTGVTAAPLQIQADSDAGQLQLAAAVEAPDADKDIRITARLGDLRTEARTGLIVTKKFIMNAIGMKLVLIPAGKFTMGSPADEQGRPTDEGPQHEVEITRPFYMGVYEVTQEDYEKLTGSNPSHFSTKGGGSKSVQAMDTKRFPVETVSWDEAVEFCNKLSELPDEKKAGRVYRLPSEAEWEFACRAGKTTVFHYGNALSSDQANFNFNGNFLHGGALKGKPLARTTTVGSYPANAWGLHDMHGNVWEWCLDGPRTYTSKPVKNPRGPETAGGSRVLRGGCWYKEAWLCRSAFRNRISPSYRRDDVGFRVVLPAPREDPVNAIPVPKPPEAPTNEIIGFSRLDNGKDLEGFEGKLDGWSVIDGAIHLDSKKAAGNIYTKTVPSKNCIIRLQFRAAKGADSGVFIHGSQLQVRDYPNTGPKEYAKPAKPAGEWNDLEWDITDGVAVVKLNGEEIEKAWKIGGNAKQGIGLQKERGDFDFRHIRIKEKK